MGAAPAGPPPRAPPGVPRAGCAASEAGLPVRGVQVARLPEAWRRRRRRLPAPSSVCKRFRGKAALGAGGAAPAAGPCGRRAPPLSRARGPGLRCAPGRCPHRGFPALRPASNPFGVPGRCPWASAGVRSASATAGAAPAAGGTGPRAGSARGAGRLATAPGRHPRAAPPVARASRPRATAPRPARLHWVPAPGLLVGRRARRWGAAGARPAPHVLVAASPGCGCRSQPGPQPGLREPGAGFGGLLPPLRARARGEGSPFSVLTLVACRLAAAGTMDVDAEREKITQEIQALERILGPGPSGFDEEVSESSLGSDSDAGDAGELRGSSRGPPAERRLCRGSCRPWPRGAAGPAFSPGPASAHTVSISPGPARAPACAGQLRQAVLGESRPDQPPPLRTPVPGPLFHRRKQLPPVPHSSC